MTFPIYQPLLDFTLDGAQRVASGYVFEKTWPYDPSKGTEYSVSVLFREQFGNNNYLIAEAFLNEGLLMHNNVGFAARDSFQAATQWLKSFTAFAWQSALHKQLPQADETTYDPISIKIAADQKIIEDHFENRLGITVPERSMLREAGARSFLRLV